MRRKYEAPKIRKIDFEYDEQVVAQSVPCRMVSTFLDDLTQQDVCFDLLLDKPYKRSAVVCQEYNLDK